MNNADKHRILRILDRAHMDAMGASHDAIESLLPQGGGIRTASVDSGWISYCPNDMTIAATNATIDEGPEVAIERMKAAIKAKEATK